MMIQQYYPHRSADIAGILADEITAPTSDYWTDGTVRIPRASSPERPEYERKFLAAVRKHFLRPGYEFEPRMIEVGGYTNRNIVRNYDRYEMYKRLLRSGELPLPIVIEGRVVVDGNHRYQAAVDEGIAKLPALVIVRARMWNVGSGG